MAGDTNKLLYRVDPVDCSVKASYPYPEGIVNCYGITIEYESSESNIIILGKDVLNKIKFVRVLSTSDDEQIDLEVKNSYYVQNDSVVRWNDTYTGLTRKGFRYFAVGGSNGGSIYELNRTGQVLKEYTHQSSYPCGITYANSRFYLGCNASSKGTLDKYELDFENKNSLEGVEPFLLCNFYGDMDTDKDCMWAVTGKQLYKYSIVYYTYIIDGVAYDEVDMGVVKAGGQEITKVTFKNISDSFVFEDVTLSIVPDDSTDAEDYLQIAKTAEGVWGTSLGMSGVLGIDGEFDFYLKVSPPADLSQEGNPRVAKISVSCKMY